MEPTKITNGLLAIIAICLLWIAFKPDDGSSIGTGSLVRSVAAETEGDLRDDPGAPIEGELRDDPGEPLEVICTLSYVDEAAARALVSGLQTEVITALNQTNEALWDMQGPLSEIVRSMQQVQGQLQNIDQNTRAY